MSEQGHFCDLEQRDRDRDAARIVIVSAPYDGTSTWGKGADRGPAAIIEASRHMELYDIETSSQVYEEGIHTAEPVDCGQSPDEMVEAVRAAVEEFLGEGKFVVTLGGEHSISVGAIEAHTKSFGDVTVVQLDAHADMRQEYLGSRYNHACVMARAKETADVVQVGIRSMDVEEKAEMDMERVFLAAEIHGRNDWIEEAIEAMGERVYVTVDLDVFDPAVMPSTGTPEPGGMGWYEVLRFMREVFRAREVVGFDVVELCPNEGNRAADFLAAKLIYKMLSYKFRDRK